LWPALAYGRSGGLLLTRHRRRKYSGAARERISRNGLRWAPSAARSQLRSWNLPPRRRPLGCGGGCRCRHNRDALDAQLSSSGGDRPTRRRRPQHVMGLSSCAGRSRRRAASTICLPLAQPRPSRFVACTLVVRRGHATRPTEGRPGKRASDSAPGRLKSGLAHAKQIAIRHQLQMPSMKGCER
jgi:hypothetical protein